MIKLYETIKMNPAISPLAVTVKLLFRAAVAILTLGIAVSSEAQEYTGDGADRDSKPHMAIDIECAGKFRVVLQPLL